MTHTPDAIDTALDIAPGSPLHALRAKRPAFVAGAEACRAAVLFPQEDLGLSSALRNALARRVSAGAGNARLTDGFALPSDPALATLAQGGTPADPALRALAHHADVIAADPATCGPEHLAALQAVGFSVPQIIALSELLAYACYQIRVVHGLNLLKESRP